MVERVFVSSTYEDLKEYRASVLSQLKKLGMEDVAMEHYSAEERGPLERCLADVRSCDLHVTVLAWRYGFVPAGQTKSITELEYRQAGDCHIERFVFLLKEDTPWSPLLMDSQTGDGDKGRCIRDFREELTQAHVVNYFANKEGLASELATAIARWLPQRAAQVARPAAASAWDALRDYVGSQVALDAAIEPRYVDLGGTTQVARTAVPVQWPEALLPPAFRAGYESAEVHRRPQELAGLEIGLHVHRQFVLLGDPGSGKTTTLRCLRLKAARAALADPAAPVPLLIKLPEWPASITDFASLLVHEREVQGVPLLNPSRMLLLVDGLNEIDSEGYDGRVGLLEAWLRQNSSVHVVVASRTRHYQQHQQLQLPIVTIHPLDEPRIRDFTRKCLGSDASEELMTELDDRLLRLARNPFLLALLCYVYQQRGGHLPRTRGELLRDAIHRLYLREQERGNASDISCEALIEALGALALGVVQSRSATSVSREWANKRLPVGLDADRFVRLATNANLIELSKKDRFLQFSHQLYLEHFAAEHLVCHPDRLGTALPTPTFENGDRVTRTFDEVAYALVGLRQADETIAEIAARDPFLAADALACTDLGGVSVELQSEIARRLLQQLEHEDDDRRTAAVARLVHLGEAAVPGLQALLGNGDLRARRLALSALGQMGSLDALEGVVSALLDRNRWVRRDAQKILTNLDEEERILMSGYLAERLAALEEVERGETARALGDCWIGQDPGLLAELCEAARIPEEVFASNSEEADGAAAEPAAEPTLAPEDEISELGALGQGWIIQWRETGGDASLEREGRRWLRGASPEDSHWGVVWTCLWEAHPGDAQLSQRGREWLAVAPLDHGSWGYVWLALWKQTPGDWDLARAGRAWLRDAPLEHGSWHYLWDAQWQLRPGDPELAAWARSWLRDASLLLPAWSFVWRGLWKVAPGDEDLRRQLLRWGRRWLERRQPTTPGWAIVWEPVLAAFPDDRDLLEQGWRWLEPGFAGRSSWPRVWQILWERAPESRGRLADAAKQWLASQPVLRNGVIQIWLTLWAVAAGDQALVRWAAAFLKAAPEHPDRSRIEAARAETGAAAFPVPAET
jgi:Domain of unknown function (DUF4062)/NACHT domain/HEAT repeats